MSQSVEVGWSILMPISELSAKAKTVSVEADEKSRQFIANFLEITVLDELRAELRLHRTKRGVRVRGQVRFAAVQECVVTLADVPTNRQIEIDRTYLVRPKSIPNGSQRELPELGSMQDLDESEELEADNLDLVSLIIEEIVLALDTYPRVEDADFVHVNASEEDGPELDEAKPSPFDVLASLTEPKH